MMALSTTDERINNIKLRLDSYFKQRSYFCCVYGSSQTGKENKDSDIDVIIATSEYNTDDVENVKNFIVKLHVENNLKVDNEVPFENKLFISYYNLEQAVRLHMFEYNDNIFNIGPIYKTPTFLKSEEVRLRLAFNALTTPHVFLGNDFVKYSYFCEKAGLTLTLLAIANSKMDRVAIHDLVRLLLIGDGGVEGELYLGYKDYPKVKIMLETILQHNFEQLVADNILQVDGDHWIINKPLLSRKIRDIIEPKTIHTQ